MGTTNEAKSESRSLGTSATPFATPKPERLLERIVHIATQPGDLVLDCFLGSGTTAAVAQKMGRRWVATERSAETLDIFAIPRLTKVVAGEDPGGITESVDWQGGGGFRVLDVAPSMFVGDVGVVLLGEWATNGMLAEATAAQLGFEYEAEAPFAGRRGRTRLAVIDGLVSQDAARLIAGAVAENEKVVLCGTVIDPLAGKVLRQLCPGSKVRKIPASILEEYRVARWSPAVTDGAKGRDPISAPTETKQ